MLFVVPALDHVSQVSDWEHDSPDKVSLHLVSPEPSLQPGERRLQEDLRVAFQYLKEL